jgi:hypothetical protein
MAATMPVPASHATAAGTRRVQRASSTKARADGQVLPGDGRPAERKPDLDPNSFCTQLTDCSRFGCSSTRCVTDENPRTCSDLLVEINALIDAAEDALTEACALTDIIHHEEPTLEVRSAADDHAVTLFLGRRALDSAIHTLSQRPVRMPVLLTGIRTVIELDTACRALVDSLVDEIRRRVA